MYYLPKSHVAHFPTNEGIETEPLASGARLVAERERGWVRFGAALDSVDDELSELFAAGVDVDGYTGRPRWRTYAEQLSHVSKGRRGGESRQDAA